MKIKTRTGRIYLLLKALLDEISSYKERDSRSVTRRFRGYCRAWNQLTTELNRHS